MPARLAAALTLALVVPATIMAQPSSRPEVARGLNAAERRAWEQRIDQLTRTNGLQANTIARIAAILELEYTGLSARDLIARLEAQVDRAVQLDRQIEGLRAEIATLRGASRDRADALLAQARAAFDAGDFPAAEQLFSDLGGFLTERADGDLALFIEAVQARALAAELSGTEDGYERARQYRIDGRRQVREQRRQLEIGEWEMCFAQADTDLERVTLFGTGGLLQGAADGAAECADILGSPERDPLRWGRTQTLIGRIAAERANIADAGAALPLYEIATTAFDDAIETIDPQGEPAYHAQALRFSATMLVQQAFRRGAPEAFALLDLASSRLAQAEALFLIAQRSEDAGLARSDAAVAFHTRSQLLNWEERIAALSAMIAQGDAARELLGDDASAMARATVHHNLCTGHFDRAWTGASLGRTLPEVSADLAAAAENCEQAMTLQDVEAFPLMHATLRITRAQVHYTFAITDAARCEASLAASEEDASLALSLFASSPQTNAQAAYSRRILAAIRQFDCSSVTTD